MEIHHHGYLLTGDIEKATGVAFEMASKILEQGLETLHAHSDFLFIENSPFSVDDARRIRDRSSRKSFSGKGRVFLIKTNSFTREAGNALLKTLEEPAGLSYFLVATGSSENVLGTLRSRLVPITFYPDAELSKEKREFVEKFLSSSFEKRADTVKKTAEDKNKAASFLDSLELFFREKLIENFSGDMADLIEDIGRKRDLLRGRSASAKMILEHLSLTLPRL